MSKESIFITGIAGFLGSHIAERLIAEGHHVWGCDSLVGGDPSNVPKEAELLRYDCNDLEKNRDAMKGAGIVIHTAAAAYEGFSLFSPQYVTENVFQNSVSVATAAINNNVRRFVYFSSMSRYGYQEELPFREEQRPNPQTPYAVAKVAAEQVIAQLCQVHNMEYVTCIPHNIIGSRQKFDDPFRNVAAIMINRMLQGKQPIIYGNGKQKRCFSDIRDTIQVLEEIIFSEKAKNQTFNIGPDEEFVSINQLAALIADEIGFKLDPIYVESRPQEVSLANCSSDKIRQVFSYKTEYSLKDSIAHMVEWIRQQQIRNFNYHIPIEIQSNKLPKTWKDRMF